MQRDACDREESIQRLRIQLPIEEKKGMADYVIDNSAIPEPTARQMRAFCETLTTTAHTQGRCEVGDFEPSRTRRERLHARMAEK